MAVVFALGLLGPAEAQAQTEGFATKSVGMLSVEAVSDEVRRAARQALRGPDDATKNGPMSRLGTELALLYHQHEAGGRAAVQSLRGDRSRQASVQGPSDPARGESRVYSPVAADGRTVVVDAVAATDVATLLDDLRALGLEDGATTGAVVSGRLPIGALEEAAQLASLRGMLPSYMRVHVGSVESEADTSHGAFRARMEKGVDGAGEKVCGLSDSYDTASGTITSASDDVESGDLPGEGNPEGRTAPVDVLADYDGSDPSPTDEGRAMLQLIHDIAPGATLGFHTAFGGVGNFAEGIRELAAAGCGVIVDDVGYSSEPFYQDGPVSNAVDEVVTSDGAAYFSSAGNNGQESYEAPFRNSGEPGVISSNSTRHDFDSSTLSTDTEQRITVESGGTFQVFSFQWTDPSAQVEGSSGADTDLDIALVDQDGEIVAESSTDNIATGVPSETMEYTNSTGSAQSLDLVIEKAAGPDPDEIKYVYSGSDFTVEEYDTLGPTLFGHPMAEGAMAVAAAPFYNTAEYNSNSDPAALEPFSSKGGIQIRFDQNGNPTTEDREKPDVTGADGIDNTFFGNDIDDDFFDGVDADPHPNFFGTSAAAPNIAAIGALIRSARPDLSPVEVYDRLESTAADVTVRQNREGDFVEIASGVDPWSGHGFVQANQAVPTPSGVQIANLQSDDVSVSSGNGTVTLRWRQIGDENVDELVVERRFFDGGFAEQDRFATEGAGEYSRTVERLTPGEHEFRVTAVERVDTDGDGSPEDRVLAQSTLRTVLRADGVDVSVAPNPFRQQARVSVTLPEDLQGREVDVQIQVFDALGRRVAIPTLERTITDSESIRLNARTLRALGSGVYFFRVIGQGADGTEFTETVQAIHVR